jgi:cytochrome P450
MGSHVTAEDLHSPDYFADPFPVWERLRHEQPLFHDTLDDRWLLTRYEDVVAVFRDHETYSTLPYERIFTDVIGPTMVQMDGADHDVRRAIVAPEMVGRKLEANFVPLIEAVIEELLRALPPAGST